MSIAINSLSKLIKTFYYNNKIINPTFSSTTNWLAIASSLTASDNTLNVTGFGNNASAQAYQIVDTPLVVGRKYYALCDVRVTNSSCNGIYFGTAADGGGSTTFFEIKLTPTQNTWYTLKGVITVPANNAGNLRIRVYHNYADAATANGKVMQVQNIMAIDLTTLYGAGNEPSAADCANIFKFVDGNTQPNFSKQIAT